MAEKSRKPLANLNMDVDTLHTLFKDDYTGPDDTFETGLAACMAFLKELDVRATFFIVGQDLKRESTHAVLRELDRQGHEIGSHSFNHPQGLTLLSRDRKESELAETEAILARVIGKKPVGFRAPCWNVDGELLEILAARGYRYDASVFPTSFSIPIKLAYLWMWRDRRWGPDRGVICGSPLLMMAPRSPYRPNRRRIWSRGNMPIVEIPVATTPNLRLPCFGTSLFQWGESVFWRMYRRCRSEGLPFTFQMHLTEWLEDQTARIHRHFRPGVHAHVPLACQIPLQTKLDLFRRIVQQLKQDYELVTMSEIAAGAA